MHTHPGQPPAGPSGHGSRCGATARAARPAAQTKQSALAVSAAQFQMPRPSRRALIGPRARGSVSAGQALPGAALALGLSAELLRAGAGWAAGGEWGGGERETETQRQTYEERPTERDRDILKKRELERQREAIFRSRKRPREMETERYRERERYRETEAGPVGPREAQRRGPQGDPGPGVLRVYCQVAARVFPAPLVLQNLLLTFSLFIILPRPGRSWGLGPPPGRLVLADCAEEAPSPQKEPEPSRVHPQIRLRDSDVAGGCGRGLRGDWLGGRGLPGITPSAPLLHQAATRAAPSFPWRPGASSGPRDGGWQVKPRPRAGKPIGDHPGEPPQPRVPPPLGGQGARRVSAEGSAAAGRLLAAPL